MYFINTKILSGLKTLNMRLNPTVAFVAKSAAEFRVAEDLSYALCPAGKRLYRNGRHCDIGGFEAVKFTGAKRDCGPCELRAQCLRHPQRTPVRQVAIFLGRLPGRPQTYTARMKRKIDTERGRYEYARRLGIVEPVFANIGHARGLKRLSDSPSWRLLSSCRMGKVKPAVLPVPVWAEAIRSRPSRTTGMALA